MHSIVLALIVVKRHCMNKNKPDVYKRIYHELQNLNIDDDACVSKAIGHIEMLLSDDTELARILVHLINQRRAVTSDTNEACCNGDGQATSVPRSAAELPNLNQKMLTAVQRILPKLHDEKIPRSATDVIQQGIPIISTSTMNASCSCPCSTSAKINLNTNSNLVSSNAGNSAATNVLKLVPLTRTICPSNKNLQVLPFSNNLLEFQSRSPKQSIISKSTESLNINRVNPYTISRMNPGYSNSRIEACYPLSTHAVTSVNKIQTQKARFSNKSTKISIPNTMKSLLNDTMNQMSDLESKNFVPYPSGMSAPAFTANKDSFDRNVRIMKLDRNTNLLHQPLRNFVGAVDNKVNTLVNPSVDVQQPLDFSIPKNSVEKIHLLPSTANIASIKEDDDNDDNTLIVVDDDNDHLIIDDLSPNDNITRKPLLEEVGLKTETPTQILSHLIERSCSPKSIGTDQLELARGKRTRKRRQLLMDDEFYQC